MSDLPPLENFPPESDDPTGRGVCLPNLSLRGAEPAYGLLVAQDGDDLYRINVNVAIGTSPDDGFLYVAVDAAGARGLAAHLLHLAEYAELGVEATPRG